MASSSNYKLLLEAQIDPKSLDAQIKSISNKNMLMMKMQLDPAGQKQFDDVLNKIKEKAKSVGKISFFGDDTGKTNKAVVDYTNQLNQSVKATITLGKELKVSETITQNLAKDAKELARAYETAEKFLGRAQKMNVSDPKVSGAIGIAQQLKVSATDGDIDSVRRLSSQLDVAKASLSGVNQGIKSWTAGMAQSLKSTIQYAASVGLLYGALNQIKEAVTFVKDLNKELVNIQLVTGGTTEDTAKLGLEYNQLAKEMGATTLEVTRGSLEFIRQGKSAEDTATLIKNSTMMSKLGNMEAAESSEALTSIMNGYKLSAEETGEVVSKLVSIKFVETYRNVWIN